MILEGSWTEQTFQPRDARNFLIGNVRGWRPAEAPPGDGEIDLDIRPGGWDHEHCELCNKTIGVKGFELGYVNPFDNWLCPNCYARYGALRSLAFAVEE